MMVKEWIFKKLLAFFKGDKTDDFKAITTSYKELNHEYRIKIEEQQQRILELQEMKGNLKSQNEREVMLDDEQSFHMDYIKLLNEHRDVLEEVYFLRYEIKRVKN